MATAPLSPLNLLSPVWAHLTPIQPEKGRGIYLFDQFGKRYIDFTSGIGVINTGHCHPKVVAAVQAQAQNLLFGQINCVIPPVTLTLAEKLDNITPPSLNQFFFTNSGAEATEASIKLAKAATGKSNTIVFQGSFHGRTHLAMSMTTANTNYRKHYQPLPAGIFVAPFPYTYQLGWTEDQAIDFCLDQLRHLLHGQTHPDETAAIIIEPVLGEGGYVPAPFRFLQELRALCDHYDILLIMDEVQTGFGRTGKMFCYEHSEVLPDILVMAKGMGSGLPISGIAASDLLMARWPTGTHGGTYGGGCALSSAAACATVDVIQSENLVENARTRGSQLLEGLRVLQQKHPVMGDVRGLGLMVACEFTAEPGKPDPITAEKVLGACLARNLLLLRCGTYKNIIRWIPPLIVTEVEIAHTLEIFAAALAENRS